MEQQPWWKEAIVYQIYPRSFKDSNGDGIGDLRGIIQKLDYIEQLGINVVWLNPIYQSPNDDNGYDISDYRSIMSEFGTMTDFEELLAGLHARGIRLIMDLVVNHCSDEHFWFRESRKSRDNAYRDYFHWVNAEDGKPAPRWSFFDPDEDAWKYDATTDAYYLHYFSQKQPDLKWENPQLRWEIYDLMHFWFRKGIDGFRMDVITFISKDTNYPPRPPELEDRRWEYFYASGPKLHDYLQEMHREVLQHYDVMTVAEGPGTTSDNVLDLVAEDRQELNLSYHFEHPHMGLLPYRRIGPGFRDLVTFKEIHTRWDAVFAERGWPTIYLANHDQPRMTTRWASDAPEHRVAAAKMLNTWLLTMRGVPFLYQGDEIGMTNPKFERIEDYRDLETINWYHQLRTKGEDAEGMLVDHRITARDNGRTPVQWSDDPQAGFTDGTPWIKVNPNYPEINAAAQEADPHSVLWHFRRLTRLKREQKILIYGTYELCLPDHPQIYAYYRKLEAQCWLVVLNFSPETVELTPPESLANSRLVINNLTSDLLRTNQLRMAPFQAVVYDLTKSKTT